LCSDPHVVQRIPADTGPLSDPISVTRVLCGALILPTIATIVGKILFGQVESNFQRTLMGGIAFIAIKGVLKIYFKQQQYIRQAQRRIMNFDEPAAPQTTVAQATQN
jgi:E3 ubiquitin-protein ligase MARCH5